MVMPLPAYAPQLAIAEITGRERVDLVVDPDAERAELDLDRLDALFADGARTLLLTQPHNPWGRVFTRAELEGVRDVVRAARRPGDHRRDPRAAGAPGRRARALPVARGHRRPHRGRGGRVEGVQHGRAALRPDRGARPRPPATGCSPPRWRATTRGRRSASWPRSRRTPRGDEWLAALVERLDGQRRLLAELLATHLPAGPDAAAGGDVPRLDRPARLRPRRPRRRRARARGECGWRRARLPARAWRATSGSTSRPRRSG